jgi:hypothetical protein
VDEAKIPEDLQQQYENAIENGLVRELIERIAARDEQLAERDKTIARLSAPISDDETSQFIEAEDFGAEPRRFRIKRAFNKRIAARAKETEC